MEPLLTLPERARNLSWNTWLLIAILTLQCFVVIVVIIVVGRVTPVVPDLNRILHVVDDTLTDVRELLPDMKSTIWDLNHMIPGITRTIEYTESICKHTVGCDA